MMYNNEKNLECPYDLSDPAQQLLWERDLNIHWYKEAFKLSYPNMYAAIKIAWLWLNIALGKIASAIH